MFCRFLRISLRQKNQLGMIMGMACSTILLLQVILYFLNNMGLMFTDTNCPFLSYAGTGTVITYILIGILLSICRYQNILPVSPPSKEFGIRGKVRA
ncbi:FtsW/RodA/SpoVE family cell cycle protein [Robinsoniella peoriensis]|uniref:FtsW/RodA/SpoVE family cell cycle protein n=1 Tax=Robinsoniella peoriensis TaxID=180332 RepID=UPI0005C7A7A0|nr:FtsW/RodA/SpoVE family cell cycle protein [Robinsoniella peoriensis]